MAAFLSLDSVIDNMPSVLPSEKGKKGQKHYLDRCFHALKEEGKPESQRIAQCLNMWKERWHAKKASGSTEPPDWSEHEIGDFILL